MLFLGLPQWLKGEESACSAGDVGSVSGSGRSPGEGNGNPVQYSCLGVPWTEEPGGLRSVGRHGVGPDRSHWARGTDAVPEEAALLFWYFYPGQRKHCREWAP